MQPEVPGGIHLCQVGGEVSCAACCGLYNTADASRGALTAMLRERTDCFRQVPRDADGIEAFGQEVKRRQIQSGPYPDFHHCPFVGFIGEYSRRVGCLLHPLAPGNNGVDFRGLSYYGGMACRVYFCPSHFRLSATAKMVLRETAADWHEYGLIVTEYTLVTEFLQALEKRLKVPITAALILGRESIRQLMRKFLRLKTDWPFRRPESGPCHYFFEDGLYPRPAVSYPPGCSGPSTYEVLLRELESKFDTRRDLLEAENTLERLVAEITRVI